MKVLGIKVNFGEFWYISQKIKQNLALWQVANQNARQKMVTEWLEARRKKQEAKEEVKNEETQIN